VMGGRDHLQSPGISLRSAAQSIDDTSTGKSMEGVLAAFAQFDNDVRSDRTRARMKAALELGRWVFLARRPHFKMVTRAFAASANARQHLDVALPLIDLDVQHRLPIAGHAEVGG
jgi:DNA invertase Pin-like site-specific DNA recombinase